MLNCSHSFLLHCWEFILFCRHQKMLRNSSMRKELLHVQKLKMQEKQFREWKKPYKNMSECLGQLGSRFLFFNYAPQDYVFRVHTPSLICNPVFFPFRIKWNNNKNVTFWFLIRNNMFNQADEWMQARGWGRENPCQRIILHEHPSNQGWVVD